jgi:hypothetical protein
MRSLGTRQLVSQPKLHWSAYLWPGLPQVWLRGSYVGLALAIGFTALANVLLVATLAWDEWLPQRTLLELLRHDGRDAEARLLLATLWRHEGRFDAASDQLDRLARLETATPWRQEIEWERERIAENRVQTEVPTDRVEGEELAVAAPPRGRAADAGPDLSGSENAVPATLAANGRGTQIAQEQATNRRMAA